MSQLDILVGLQWGDEGKGKIIDKLCKNYDVVVRFQGGPNAGHTLYVDGKKFVLHTVPSGIFTEGCTNVIGNGVVINPITLKEELEALQQYGIDTKEALRIGRKAHLILPTHIALDHLYEEKQNLGTTLRGIGPTYIDKVSRRGLQIGSIFSKDFEEHYKKLETTHIDIFEKYNFQYDKLQKLTQAWWEGIEYLKSQSFVSCEYYLNDKISEGQRLLGEGAQGTLLDLEYGSYPFVTSSNTIAAHACIGLGVSPRLVGDIIGISKAYCTRVGAGTFPTELTDSNGKILQEKGREFGATTGRERRCGWLDLPALKYACMVNGVNKLIITKVDVLQHLKEIQLAIHYLGNQKQKIYKFSHLANNQNVVYQAFSSFSLDSQLNHWRENDNLNTYLKYIEEYTEVPISAVSHGVLKEDIWFSNN